MAAGTAQEMDPFVVEDITNSFPKGTKTLRACMRCRIIMTKEQFFNDGCPHCESLLGMKGSEGRVVACTTTNFTGFLSMIQPGTFVSRFNGLAKRKPGCYALKVSGSIPSYILHEDRDLGDFAARPDRPVPSQDSPGEEDDASDDEPLIKRPRPDVAAPVPESASTAHAPAAAAHAPPAHAIEKSTSEAERHTSAGESQGAASSSTLILEREGDTEFIPAPF